MAHLLRAAAFALLLLAVPAAAQLTADKAEKSFTVSKGLEFTLWASEPMFVNPTCMDIDHKGRVWVCESVNYRNKLRNFKKLTRAEGDRIVILEDEKGTGKATKATTFYQSPEMMAPLGIAVAPYPDGKGVRVYVCQSPDLLVFEDKDGDGKADGPPKKLLTGFRGVDHDHGLHSVLIGPDRKLYFTVGDAGVGGLQSSDGKGRKWTSNNTDCRAGTVWRCELDGTKLELMAHNFRNNYEVCVDSFGTMFLSDNDDDGNQQTRICHVIPGGNYGYHPRGRGESHWHEEQPGVMPKILRTYFGSPTGICMYEGDLLPAKYRGQILHCDAGPRHVRAYHLKPSGASYTAEREDIVESKDNWFRPSDVTVAPDGSVFVCDWYDPGVGGHGMGDITKGRIYRLAPAGDKSKTPTCDLTTDKGVVAALGSPNLATRAAAMAKIAEMDKKAAIALLLPVTSDRKNITLGARACWQLARLGVDPPNAMLAIDRISAGEDSRVSKLFFRLMADYDFPISLLTFASTFLGEGRVVTAKSVHPLGDVASALRNIEPEKVKEILDNLMKCYDGKDRHYLACLGIAVGSDPKRREILLADFAKKFPTWDDKVAGLVFELRPPGMAAMLAKNLGDSAVPEAQRANIVDILAAGDDKSTAETLLKLLASSPTAKVRERVLANLRTYLPTKWKDATKSEAFTAAVHAYLDKADERVTGLELVGLSGREDFRLRVVLIARNEKEPVAVRKAAVAVLPRVEKDGGVAELTKLADDATADIASAAIAAMGERLRGADPRESKPQPEVERLSFYLGRDDAAKAEAATSALAASVHGSRKLLEMKKEAKLPPAVGTLTARLLRNSPYPEIRNRALIAFPPPGRINVKALPTVAALAKMKGNAENGRKLLAASAKGDMQCLKCHVVNGLGGRIGPDLSMIGKKASRENLFESILYPSKAIADQYVMWTVTTARGISVQGLIVEETDTHVVVRDGEGRDTKLSRNAIAEKVKSPKSIMPEELAGYFSEQELADVVEHLLTLKTASVTPAEWRVIGPFDNGEGMAGLDKVFPPEKGIDFAASYDGKSGKVTWKTVKADTTGYIDLKAHYGAASPQIVSYLVADVESAADQTAVLKIGTDDGAKLWQDGKQVFVTRETRAASPEQNAVPLKLKKGVNRFVLKINNGDGPHGFYLTLGAEQELKQVPAK